MRVACPIVGILAAVAAAATAPSAPAPEGRLHALIVGVNSYRDESIPSLRFAVSDATAVAEKLKETGDAAGALGNVTLLTEDGDAAHQPTRDAVLGAVDQIAAELQPADKLLFYFAGHGVNRDGEDYLLPADCNDESTATIVASSVPVSGLLDKLLKIRARQVLLIIDACRDAEGPETGVFGSTMRTFSLGDDADTANQVRASLSAARPGQRAYEWPREGHGVFTYYLLEGLGGAAAEDNGAVTDQSLATYVQNRVSDWTRQYLRGRRSQLPWLLRDGVAPMVLRRYSPKNLVTIDARQQPLRDVLQQMADAVQFDLILAPGVPADQRVDVALNAKPLTEALGLLLRPLQLNFEVQEKIIVVSRPEPREAAPPPPATGPVGRDGMPLVLVPGGTYRRGSDRKGIQAALELATTPVMEIQLENELSIDDVSVDSFYLDAHEVTRGQYAKFMADNGYFNAELWTDEGWAWRTANNVTQPLDWDPGADPELPVAGVSWFEADAYARWAGRRLPTEAEWELAAQGGRGWTFATGETVNADIATIGTTAPTRVMSHAPTPLGFYDLTGNVAEWCVDVYDPGFYRWGERLNPLCAGTLYVDAVIRRSIRGGGYNAEPFTARVRRRTALEPGERVPYVGFRCAVELRRLWENR